MTISERYALQIIRLWVVRRDVYVIQRPGTSSPGEGKPLTDEVIAQASRGEIPLVLFPCGKDGCGFSDFDIDVKIPGQEEQNEQIAWQLWGRSGPGTILVRSGPGSYHVTKFYSQPQRPEQLVAFQASLMADIPRYIEICPRAPKDKFPRSFSALRIPGINPKPKNNGFLSEILDGDRRLIFGTEDFVSFLENFKTDAEPNLPAADPWQTKPKTARGAFSNSLAPSAPPWQLTDAPKQMWKRLFKAVLAKPGEAFKKTFAAEVKTIPCGECATHTKSYVKANPIPDALEDQFPWLVGFKNYVNEKTGKPTITVDEARQVWG